MTDYHSTTSPAVSENNAYLSPNTVPFRIAEDTGEYTATPGTDPTLAPALKQLEVKAIGNALAGQITRLYGMVSLLLPNEQPTDRTGEELRQLAIELEQATAIIEETVNNLLAEIAKDE